MDKAGRVVIPRSVRDQLGLLAGEIVLTVDGSCVRIEPVTDDTIEERDGRFIIPAGGAKVDDELVQTLRDADQR